MRNVIVRITLDPGLLHIHHLVQVAGHISEIFFGNVVTLALAHSIAEVVGLLRILRRQLCLKHIVIHDGQPGVGDCEVWIKLDRTFVKGNRLELIALQPLLITL